MIFCNEATISRRTSMQHRNITISSAIFWILGVSIVAGCAPKRTLIHSDPCTTEMKNHRTVVPVARTTRAGWMERHDLILNRIKKNQVDLLFIGNSITQRWELQGKKAWETYFAPLHAVNAGIDGDCTQHLIWRLDNGLMEGISPKLIILLIGSNHVNDYTAGEIVDGIKAITCRIRNKLPKTKVLILGVLPRGTASPAGAYRLAKASESASKIADNQKIYYLDVSEKFFDTNGDVSSELMTADRVHLSEAGYNLLAETLKPTIARLMNK